MSEGGGEKRAWEQRTEWRRNEEFVVPCKAVMNLPYLIRVSQS